MKMKKVTALLLSAVMAVSGFAGCGKDKNESKKVEPEKLETIADALLTYDSYTKGSFSINCSLDVSKDGVDQSLLISGGGDRVGDDYRTGALLQVEKKAQILKLNLMNSLVILDNKAYISFDRLLDSVANVSGSTIGSYGIAMPDISKDKKEAYKQKLNAAVKDLLGVITASAKIEGEKGSFTATIDSPEAYKQMVSGFYTHVYNNWDQYLELYKETYQLFDAKSYVSKLFSDMKSDVISAANAIGYNLDESTYDSFKSQVLSYADEIEEPDYDQLKEDLECRKLTYEHLSDDDWKNFYDTYYKQNPPQLSVKADTDSFEVKLILGLTVDGDSVGLDISYRFTNDNEVKVEKPSNIRSLKQMADYLNEHQDVMQKIVYGLISSSY